MSSRLSRTGIFLIAILLILGAAAIAFFIDQKKFDDLLSKEVPEGACFIVVDFDQSVPSQLSGKFFDDLSKFPGEYYDQPSAVMISNFFGRRRARIIRDLSEGGKSEEYIRSLADLLEKHELRGRTEAWYLEPSGAHKL